MKNIGKPLKETMSYAQSQLRYTEKQPPEYMKGNCKENGVKPDQKGRKFVFLFAEAVPDKVDLMFQVFPH